MNPSAESVWEGFKSQLLGYIRTKVSDSYAAEDILQEVFIKVHAGIGRLENAASLRSWLYTITRNAIVDYYRQGAGDAPLDVLADNPGDEPETANMNEEIAACLKTLMSGLPDKYREPLELHTLHGLKHREIAARLGVTVSGSKTRLQRARDLLRRLLADCCALEFDRRGNIVDYRKRADCACSDTCR